MIRRGVLAAVLAVVWFRQSPVPDPGPASQSHDTTPGAATDRARPAPRPGQPVSAAALPEPVNTGAARSAPETAPAAIAAASARPTSIRSASGPAQRVAPALRAPPAPEAGQSARPFPPRDAEAVVTTGAGTFRLDPDPAGDFPQILTGPQSTAEVRVAYADREGPADVILQVEDGGTLAGGDVVRPVRLGENNSLHFAFVTSVQRGHHRVTLRRGADVKALDFWVETEREQGGTP